MAKLKSTRGWAFVNPKFDWVGHTVFFSRTAAIDSVYGKQEPTRSRYWRQWRRRGTRLVRARVVTEEKRNGQA